MEKSYPGETWKNIEFKYDFPIEGRVEISNFGRVKTFNKNSDGNIINGSGINGYKILRLKFYKPRDKKAADELFYHQEQVAKLALKIKTIKQEITKRGKKSPITATEKNELEGLTQLKKNLQSNLSKKFTADLLKRVVYYQQLVHRVVAEYFIHQPSKEHTVVAHIDYNKLNNRVSNLKWMTLEENYAHQQKSPIVIASKGFNNGRRKEDSKATKLSVTKVMLLKKLLNEGKPIRSLVKQFKVTETQILRIKRGENWTDVKAAPSSTTG